MWSISAISTIAMDTKMLDIEYKYKNHSTIVFSQTNRCSYCKSSPSLDHDDVVSEVGLYEGGHDRFVDC